MARYSLLETHASPRPKARRPWWTGAGPIWI